MNNWKPYASLAGLCFLWGTTYIGIKIGVQHFPTFLFSGIRFIISGVLILAAFGLSKSTIWPAKREVLQLTIGGIFIFVGGNLLLCIAELIVPSGLAALVNTAFPLWIVIITRIWNPSEKTPLAVIIGIITGFAGQLMIFYEQLYLLKNSVYTTGILLLIAGVINGSFGSVHMKKYPVKKNPVLCGGIQMLTGGCITTLVGLFRGESSHLNTNPDGWYAMLYLIIAGSVIGYSLFVYAMQKLPAAMVSVYAYINPIVALWLGTIFLNESVSTRTIVAMIVTLTGVYIVNRGMSLSLRKQ